MLSRPIRCVWRKAPSNTETALVQFQFTGVNQLWVVFGYSEVRKKSNGHTGVRQVRLRRPTHGVSRRRQERYSLSRAKFIWVQLSLVERGIWDAEVVCSNHISQTSKKTHTAILMRLDICFRGAIGQRKCLVSTRFSVRVRAEAPLKFEIFLNLYIFYKRILF